MEEEFEGKKKKRSGLFVQPIIFKLINEPIRFQLISKGVLDRIYRWIIEEGLFIIHK